MARLKVSVRRSHASHQISGVPFSDLRQNGPRHNFFAAISFSWFFKNTPLCALPLDSYLSVHLSSVQLCHYLLAALQHTHAHTHTQPTTNDSTKQLISIFIFVQTSRTTYLCAVPTPKQKQQKPPSSCLADLTTPPALSSLVLPSPPRARSALSSFPFLSNETMQHLRLDFCYEPACLRATL